MKSYLRGYVNEELKWIVSDLIKWELHQETLQSTNDSLTVAHYIRRSGTDDNWVYCGTVTHYADGTNELEDV
jgi:hypothetical protein